MLANNLIRLMNDTQKDLISFRCFDMLKKPGPLAKMTWWFENGPEKLSLFTISRRCKETFATTY